ncbi:hypothetical protein HMPREF0208_01284 [Citrobacter koseri]|nr:hypothetical protein HMPREF3207_00253 [Citrobacter koseri]KXB45540.1 hypothetical protein HMPREF0208_01284 [Citrobacter koseri]
MFSLAVVRGSFVDFSQYRDMNLLSHFLKFTVRHVLLMLIFTHWIM